MSRIASAGTIGREACAKGTPRRRVDCPQWRWRRTGLSGLSLAAGTGQAAATHLKVPNGGTAILSVERRRGHGSFERAEVDALTATAGIPTFSREPAKMATGQKPLWTREKIIVVKIDICEPMKGAEMATAAKTARIFGTNVRVIS